MEKQRDPKKSDQCRKGVDSTTKKEKRKKELSNTAPEGQYWSNRWVYLLLLTHYHYQQHYLWTHATHLSFSVHWFKISLASHHEVSTTSHQTISWAIRILLTIWINIAGLCCRWSGLRIRTSGAYIDTNQNATWYRRHRRTIYDIKFNKRVFL